MKYNEIYVSFAMDKLTSPRFDLLIGFHPQKNRHLTEEEEQLFFSFLKYVSRKEMEDSIDSIGYQEVAKQFLKYFPHIETYRDERNFYKEEWGRILKEIDTLQIGYIFHPDDFEIKRKLQTEIDNFKELLHQKTEGDVRAKGKITWTFPLPLSGDFGQQVENRHGITSQFKKKVSLNKYPSGFIANYLANSDAEFPDLLKSRQFEELIGMLYENEGWEVKITKKTRDGGKDAIATKVENGEKVVAYIEAKNPIKNKINESKVREFFAVIRDETDHGYFVTSSEFTKDAKKWLERKKLIAPVILELIDKTGVRNKLRKIAGEEGYKYLLKI